MEAGQIYCKEQRCTGKRCGCALCRTGYYGRKITGTYVSETALDNNDAVKLHECRQKLLQSTDYLQNLINNVLDISKLESGSLVLEHKSFDLAELLRNNLTVVAMSAYENGVRFEGGVEASTIRHRYLIGSPVHLSRVLMNLSSNAIKYNHFHGNASQKDSCPKGMDLSGKRVLLVEDNAINMEIAHAILEEEHLNITEAKNGKEALEIFQNSKPNEYDFIIMDVMMPVMDGLEATKAIRMLEREDAKKIPIIDMTANAFEEDC